MVNFNSPAATQGDRPAQYLTIEDEEEDTEVRIDLTGLDDEQEGIDIIREITPADRQSANELPFGCENLQSAVLNGKTLSPGSSLELRDGDFLQNIRIFRDLSNDEITVDGNLCMRTSRRPPDLKGMLATNRVNELCLVMRAPSALKDATLAECRVVRALKAAKCEREIILTNKSHSAYSVYDPDPPYFYTDEIPVIRNEAQLVCRWRVTEETFDSGKKTNSGSLRKLRREECDKDTSEPDMCLLNDFLEEKQKRKQTPQAHEKADTADSDPVNLVSDDDEVTFVSESSDSKKRRYSSRGDKIDLTRDSDEEVTVVSGTRDSRKRRYSSRGDKIDLTGDNDDGFKITKIKFTETIEQFTSAKRYKVKRTTSSTITNTFPVRKRSSLNAIFESRSSTAQDSHRYTFGDLCAGAGGVTSGAEQAGLRLNFLLDSWDTACNTLKRNFHRDRPKVLLCDIYDFCTKEWNVDCIGVDVLHISFPCQPHSPAHTRDGKNDSANIATSYSVIPILQRCKPRIVTFEQTSGIVTHNGGVHFRALIHQITDSGYSVRWKICNLIEYSNAQPRKRLIIIAACPGETLPPFPEPTHGLGFSKLPFVTVHDVLHRIRNCRVPENMRVSKPMNVAPYDARKPLQHCITCTGLVPHPSGTRSFTLFELAALQGFLPTHRFSGLPGQIRKQIGNAVPSMFAKALLHRITESLKESDAKLDAWNIEVVEVD